LTKENEKQLLENLNVDPISNEDLTKALNEIFNVWWMKWRKQTGLSADDWDQIFKQADYLVKKYGNHIMVFNITQAIIDELEAREKHENKRKSGGRKLL
jgi:hypothetical protein